MLSLFASVSIALLTPQSPPSGPDRSAPPKQEKGKPTSKPAMSWTGVLSEDAFASLHELKKGKAPKLLGEDITIGKAKAYLSMPKAGRPRAAVLVIHEWWGLNRHVKHWTDRLAADGYAALAIDLYGGIVAKDRQAAMEAMQAVDPDAALATLKAAHAFLATSPKINVRRRACIGWCFGGGWSLKLAMAAPDLDAAVIYYGRLIDDPKQLASIQAPILGVFGNQDRGIPPKSVAAFAAAMKTAGKSLELHQYDANHAFANPSSGRYDQKNAAAAWREVRRFLKARLLAPAAPDESKGSFAAGTGKLRYATPKGWRKGTNSSTMRTLTLNTGKDSECYVTVLGGNGGGVQANLDRWRGQMGRKGLSAAEVAKLPEIPMLGRKGVYARIDGSMGKFEEAVMLVAICKLDNRTVFVKMTGPRREMDGEEKRFQQFCASLQ